MPNGWSVVLGDPGMFCATCGKWGQPLPVPPRGGWPTVEWPHRYHELRWSSDDPTYAPVRAWWDAMYQATRSQKDGRGGYLNLGMGWRPGDRVRLRASWCHAKAGDAATLVRYDADRTGANGEVGCWEFRPDAPAYEDFSICWCSRPDDAFELLEEGGKP